MLVNTVPAGCGSKWCILLNELHHMTMWKQYIAATLRGLSLLWEHLCLQRRQPDLYSAEALKSLPNNNQKLVAGSSYIRLMYYVGAKKKKKTLWKFMFAIFTKIIYRICIKNTKMWSGNVISLNRMKRVNFSRRVDFLLAPFSLLRGLLSQWWKGLSTLLSSELPTRSLLTGHKCTSYIRGPLFNWTNQ